MYQIINYDNFKKAWESCADTALLDNVKVKLSSVKPIGSLWDVRILFTLSSLPNGTILGATIPLTAHDCDELKALAQILVGRLKAGETNFPDDIISKYPV